MTGAEQGAVKQGGGVSTETTRVRLNTGVFVSNSRREAFPSKLARLFSELVQLRSSQASQQDDSEVSSKLSELERALSSAHSAVTKNELCRTARLNDKEMYSNMADSLQRAASESLESMPRLEHTLRNAKAERQQLEQQEHVLQEIVQHQDRQSSLNDLHASQQEVDKLLSEKDEHELAYETHRKQIAALAAYIEMLQEDFQSPSSSFKQLLTEQERLHNESSSQQQQQQQHELGEYNQSARPVDNGGEDEPMEQG